MKFFKWIQVFFGNFQCLYVFEYNLGLVERKLLM